jgi:hypothetical protein
VYSTDFSSTLVMFSPPLMITSLDLKVPVRVHHAHVARVEPPVVVEVAEHDARAAEHELGHGRDVAGHAATGARVHDVHLGQPRLGRARQRAVRDSDALTPDILLFLLLVVVHLCTDKEQEKGENNSNRKSSESPFQNVIFYI